MKKSTLIISFVIVATAFAGGVFYMQNRTADSELDISSAPTTLPKETPAQADTGSPTSEDTEVATQHQTDITPQPVKQEETRASSVPNSPKQTEVRESTNIERTYYPLATPNDPGYPVSNWALTSINAPAAWDIATGDNSTTIAVLDTGFALNHEDLTAAWHTNDGETGVTSLGDPCWTGTPANKATNNCDDDQNGYIDDWRGWNFYNGTNNPMAGQNDPNGDAVSHGTEVAGLAGAVGDNGIGIATVNWATRLMPLKVLSDQGPGYTSDIAAAIYYAVDNGADIINLSLGGNEPDATMRAATDYAYEHDVVVIAAAGNCGTGTEDGCQGYAAGFIGYPARNPHVISVGATNTSSQRASFSSYGAALDVVAPGSGSIYSPTYTAENATTLYATSLYGTSFASPIVASFASLVKSVDPSISVDEMTALILGTTQKTNISNGVYLTEYGHGRIDTQKALAVAPSLASSTSTPTLYQTGGHRSEHTYRSNGSMGSGCEVTSPNSYCTVRFVDEVTGYERFLPYTRATDTYASWSWSTSILGSGIWELRAVQASAQSSGYVLSNK